MSIDNNRFRGSLTENKILAVKTFIEINPQKIFCVSKQTYSRTFLNYVKIHTILGSVIRLSRMEAAKPRTTLFLFSKEDPG